MKICKSDPQKAYRTRNPMKPNSLELDLRLEINPYSELAKIRNKILRNKEFLALKTLVTYLKLI